MIDVERAVGEPVVDDAHAFDVARPVERALQPRRHEERARVDEIDRERGKDAPGQPVVPPRALLRIEGEVADLDAPVRERDGAVVEHVREVAGALDGRADAHGQALDLGLFGACASPRGPGGFGSVAMWLPSTLASAAPGATAITNTVPLRRSARSIQPIASLETVPRCVRFSPAEAQRLLRPRGGDLLAGAAGALTVAGSARDGRVAE